MPKTYTCRFFDGKQLKAFTAQVSVSSVGITFTMSENEKEHVITTQKYPERRLKISRSHGYSFPTAGKINHLEWFFTDKIALSGKINGFSGNF